MITVKQGRVNNIVVKIMTTRTGKIIEVMGTLFIFGHQKAKIFF